MYLQGFRSRGADLSTPQSAMQGDLQKNKGRYHKKQGDLRDATNCQRVAVKKC